MIHENEYVCFCLAKRHPNVFMGRRLPSNCRYCNSPFDINSVMSKADAESKGMLKMPEETAPKAPAEEPAARPAEPTTPAQPGFGAGRPAPAQPTGFGAGRPAAPAQPAGFGAGRPAPAQPTGFGAGRPAAHAQPAGFGAGRPAVPAQPTGFGAGRPAVPAQPGGLGAGRPVPAQPGGFGAGRPAVPAQPSGFGAGRPAPAPSPMMPDVNQCHLDYFGETISIPHDGGWLGRSAIGNEWFKGNLLISREHIRVLPMANGSLQVGPDKSLNGTSVTIGGAKRALEQNETVTLSPGDILWLYNVPLQLKRN